MISQTLKHNWTLKRINTGMTYPTSVPTSVYGTLMDQGAMDHPYWKANEEEARKLMEEDYQYSHTFSVDKTLLSYGQILLNFQGLDTLTDIYLNDTFLGSTSNMHRVWEFSVKHLLKAEQNQLIIHFHSPLAYVDKAFKHCPTLGTEDAWNGFSHLRKAHYMFGWDWGAHLPDAGIFRDVTLIGIHHGRIDSVSITQSHQPNLVRLKLAPSFHTEKEWQKEHTLHDLGVDFTYHVSITDPDGSTVIFTDAPSTLEIKNPKLWWPNGLGDQPLYHMKVTLLYKQTPIDSWSRNIGLRTLTMKIEKDQWGESFAHEINGKTVFAMGADYIPEEHILPHKKSKDTKRLLEDCKLANFNSIRVWGGGYYPDDDFYDLCDSLGFIVWQDFMFACSVYELTQEFEDNITQEFIDNIKRIRHHSCLGLWCGNNEMESFVKDGEWVSKPSEIRDYLFMYERIIPKVLKKYDPETFYWPSSPSSGGSFDLPQDPNRGDVHYWDVWHGNKPFSAYRDFGFRYLSEFGFQSLPAIKTIQEGITDDPQDMNLFSYIMEKHQRNHSANGKIMNYMQQTYKYPNNFSSVVYASQLLQADAIRYGVEHFRRNRGRCMGAVYWQLNDCWPVISWSSIDYYGRWKALHYSAKRFFAPVMISCQEESWMTAKADMNRQHFEFEKSIHLNVTNETLETQDLIVHWALRNADGSIVKEEYMDITVMALSSFWLDKVLLPEADVLAQYVSYEIRGKKDSSDVISSGTVIFSYPKYFCYENPNLRYKVEGDRIHIYADAYAKHVELLNEHEDLILSDNYFDMNAGVKTVQVLRGHIKNLRLRSVYDIGRVNDPAIP
ncbi:MAG TPA: glycoside hydrolase family 2 protein [Candidatus Merdenecus merdavium]|nr:glycoside hydrolase family 2 protein [Candidatus Merdenecus merdavium]